MPPPAHGTATREALAKELKSCFEALTRRTLGVPAEGQAEAQPVPPKLDESVLEVRAAAAPPRPLSNLPHRAKLRAQS